MSIWKENYTPTSNTITVTLSSTTISMALKNHRILLTSVRSQEKKKELDPLPRVVCYQSPLFIITLLYR